MERRSERAKERLQEGMKERRGGGQKERRRTGEKERRAEGEKARGKPGSTREGKKGGEGAARLAQGALGTRGGEATAKEKEGERGIGTRQTWNETNTSTICACVGTFRGLFVLSRGDARRPCVYACHSLFGSATPRLYGSHLCQSVTFCSLGLCASTWHD